MHFLCLLAAVLGAEPPDAGNAPAQDRFNAEVTARFGEGVTVTSGDVKLNVRGRVQVQALSDFAHGQGLAASSRAKRAGYVAVPPTLRMLMTPLSSGWRSASSTPALNSGASSRNNRPR